MGRTAQWCRGVIVAGTVGAVGASLLVVTAATPASAAGVVSIEVDTFDPLNNPFPNVSTPGPLLSGVPYHVTVTGTYSKWAAASWNETVFHFVCGTPDPAPLFPSSGTTNGKVGVDAEGTYADVRSFISSQPCLTDPPSNRPPTFEIDTGSGYAHVAPIASSPSTHEYEYMVMGAGSVGSFRVNDSFTSDNYGVLKIDVEEGDATPPVIVPTVTPPPNGAGWNNTAPTVTWSVTDPESGVATTSGCGPTTISAETAGTTLTCSATNNDLQSSSASKTVKYDGTKPTVAYAGNTTPYTVDQTVSITCSASDALSGLASNTCAPVSGPAYTFPLGPNTRSATATDVAGNTKTVSTTFTVKVTTASLCALTKKFAATNPANPKWAKDVACKYLDKAAAATGHHRKWERLAWYAAYAFEICDQVGGYKPGLTLAQKEILLRLVVALALS